MSFQVIILPRAEQQLYEAALWWSEYRSAEQAFRWLNSFQQAIGLLANNPERYAVAAESDAFPFQLRQLNYGLGSKPSHRALFEVRDEIQQVLVHSIRHLAQDDLRSDDS